jgi:bifunctional DNase/RNase
MIDSRPSDAIAVALRTMTPIYVSEEVMERAGIDNFSTGSDIAETVSSDELLKETTDEGSAIENLAEALEKAISEEEYEVAARLRDRIKQLEKRSAPQ